MKDISADVYLKDCDLTRKADEEKFFSDDELYRLLDYAYKHLDNPRALMMIFSYATGARAGEVVAIHREDIGNEFIHIHRQQVREMDSINGNMVFTEVPYTKDERICPHDGRLVPLLEHAQKAIELARAIPGDSKYLFHDPNSSEMVTKDSYMRYLKRVCEKLGCQATNNHAFRIAFNSKLIEIGFSSADRALINGHAVQTNENWYSKRDKRRLSDIRSRMVACEEDSPSVTHFLGENKKIGSASKVDFQVYCSHARRRKRSFLLRGLSPYKKGYIKALS